ncbi:hypothetical protein GCM10009113_16300 [Marinobacter szutsaonensis]
MRLTNPDIPPEWQSAYRDFQRQRERLFTIFGAWLLLAIMVAYHFSHELRGVRPPEPWSLEHLLRLPVYLSIGLAMLSHCTGVPGWHPKVFLRMMSTSLMLMMLGLFLVYFQDKPGGVPQVSEGLMISFFGVTMMATRGLRDWLVQFLPPLGLFIIAAILLRVSPADLIPHLFGPAAMLAVGLVTSETLRRLGNHQFLNEQEVKQLATTDQLTGLLNRHAFLPLIRHEMDRARRSSERPFCVIMGDLDNFKRVNDTHGHEAGDLVLRDTAVRVSACLRQQDVLCRWGGEELLILLPETGPTGGLEVARKIRAAMADQPMQVNGTRIRQTISLGVACFDGERAPEQLITRADNALYDAKAAGRNRVVMAPGKETGATPGSGHSGLG